MKKQKVDSPGAKSTRGWKIAGVLFLAGALICTAVACAEKETQSQAEEEYDRLAEQTSATPEPEESPEVTQAPEETPAPAERIRL